MIILEICHNFSVKVNELESRTVMYVVGYVIRMSRTKKSTARSKSVELH